MSKRGGRVPGIASEPKDVAWVRAVRCVGCGGEGLHIELSLVEDDRHGWPVTQPCPWCGRLGMIKEVAS